jgi:hypothetical protein
LEGGDAPGLQGTAKDLGAIRPSKTSLGLSMTKWSAAPNRQNEATLSAGQPGGATGGRIPGRVQCVRPPGDPPGAVCASGRPVSTFLPPAVGDWEPSRSQAAPASVGAIDPARTPHADALRRYVTAPTMARIPFPRLRRRMTERPQRRTPGLRGESRAVPSLRSVCAASRALSIPRAGESTPAVRWNRARVPSRLRPLDAERLDSASDGDGTHTPCTRRRPLDYLAQSGALPLCG